MNLKIQTRAGQLPEEWDVLAGDNPYLKRNFLSFIEQTEREYRPRYYLFYEGTRADSCFVAYRNRKFDIGMFTPKRIYRPVTMIYLPMSVTRAGIVTSDSFQQAKKAFSPIEVTPEPIERLSS